MWPSAHCMEQYGCTTTTISTRRWRPGLLDDGARTGGCGSAKHTNIASAPSPMGRSGGKQWQRLAERRWPRCGRLHLSAAGGLHGCRAAATRFTTAVGNDDHKGQASSLGMAGGAAVPTGQHVGAQTIGHGEDLPGHGGQFL